MNVNRIEWRGVIDAQDTSAQSVNTHGLVNAPQAEYLWNHKGTGSTTPLKIIINKQGSNSTESNCYFIHFLKRIKDGIVFQR